MNRMRPERPWLCEELIQHVAAIPDPLPPWAKKSPSMPESQIDFLFYVFDFFKHAFVSFLACFEYFLMGFASPNFPFGRFL